MSERESKIVHKSKNLRAGTRRDDASTILEISQQNSPNEENPDTFSD